MVIPAYLFNLNHNTLLELSNKHCHSLYTYKLNVIKHTSLTSKYSTKLKI